MKRSTPGGGASALNERLGRAATAKKLDLATAIDLAMVDIPESSPDVKYLIELRLAEIFEEYGI